jgi:hypothetical protein
MRAGRDYQRARVYGWEDRVVAPRDRSTLPYPAAQGMVSAIWADMGLRFPPEVAMLPGQARRLQADASRLLVRLPQTMPSWLLLHEIAHALSSDHEGASDGHGPTFMGLYIELLERYMRWCAAGLVISAAAAGIDIHRAAQPLFLDAYSCNPGSGGQEGRHVIAALASLG